MNSEEKELVKELEPFSVEDLYREVKSRNYKKIKDKRFQKYPLSTVIKALNGSQKVIYGVDDREDLYQVEDQAILRNADSVVSLFKANNVIDNGDGTSTLVTQNFGTDYNLCHDEIFRDQPTGSFCSGFLVARDIIATAGHCYSSSSLANTRFVFGFKMIDANTPQTIISNDEIYSGSSIIAREYSNNADWALVRLNETVLNHNIVSVRREDEIPDNQAVYVIGHPCGLPIKVAGGANVRDNLPAEYFVANLDTYGGSSGGPVINSDTHVVEGILVRGERDFSTINPGTDNECRVSHVCPTTGYMGEDCTRTTEFSDHIPNILIIRDIRIRDFLDTIIRAEYIADLMKEPHEWVHPPPPPPPPPYSIYSELGYYADISISNISPDISFEVRDENNMLLSESHSIENFQHLRIPLDPRKQIKINMKGNPKNEDVKISFEYSKLSRISLMPNKKIQLMLKKSIKKF